MKSQVLCYFLRLFMTKEKPIRIQKKKFFFFFFFFFFFSFPLFFFSFFFFFQIPPPLFSPAVRRGGLEIDLFVTALPHVADVKIAGEPIERKTPRISQA